MSRALHGPRPHRLSVDDYYRMADAGILGANERVELIEGRVFDVPPPGSLHAGTVDQLAETLQAAVGARATIRVQNPVRLDRYSEPQPDLALLRPRADFYKSAHPSAGDVLLIVEVAHSSLRHDRDVKVPLYARAAVSEVWLLDLEGAELTRYRDPKEGRYRSVERPTLDRPVEITSLPGVRVHLAGVLPS